MTYVFPFHTCERPGSHFPAQPWSFAVNLVTSLVLFALAAATKRWSLRLALLSFALFQAAHALSHAMHVPGTIQLNAMHVLAYGMAGATLWAILDLTRHTHGPPVLQPWVIGLLVFLVVLDLVSVWTQKTLWMLSTGLAVIAAAILTQWMRFPRDGQVGLSILFVGMLVLMLLIWIESKHCDRLLDRWPSSFPLPPHAIVELWSSGLLLGLAAILLRL